MGCNLGLEQGLNSSTSVTSMPRMPPCPMQSLQVSLLWWETQQRNGWRKVRPDLDLAVHFRDSHRNPQGVYQDHNGMKLHLPPDPLG